MTAKRLASDTANDGQPKEKRIRPYPSFASVIGEVMMVKSFNSFCNALEPLLRRVVNEEVERGLQKTMRTMTRSPSFRIQAPEPATLKLVFINKSLPTTFTCNKVLDINGDPLQLVLVEQRGNQITPKALSSPIKVELVVVDGDFPALDREVWTADVFNRKVVKERDGKRPLLTKEVSYVIRGMNCVSLDEIELTDNSSWIRSRKFRLGARVVGGATVDGVRVLEALTEPFVVKDHRGESYKKHYPPMLRDEVWRLQKISKDGKFHKRLDHEGINTVQDLLKLSEIDQTRVKMILGGKKGISEKNWDAIMKHARTCNLGSKLYISKGSNYTIILDPICRIISINFDGRTFSSTSDMSMDLKKDVEQLVKNAYKNWDSLQEVDKSIDENFPVPEAGNLVAECHNIRQNSTQYGIVIDGYIEVDNCSHQVVNNNQHMDIGGWEASFYNMM